MLMTAALVSFSFLSVVSRRWDVGRRGTLGRGREAAPAAHNPSPSLCGRAASLALHSKHASITLRISQMWVSHSVTAFWLPRSLATSRGSLSASMVTQDSFHQEADSVCSPLESGMLCDVL